MMRRQDLTWGIRSGLYFASAFSAYVIAVRIFRGDELFARRGVSVPALVAGYFAGGILSGIVAGLLRREATTRVRTIGSAVLVVLPILTAVGTVMLGAPARWGRDEIITLALLSLVFGTLFGNYAWKAKERERQ